MMPDLQPSGYEQLRQCGATAWTRIGVQFDGDNVFDPLPLSDSRVTQTVSDAGILYTLVLRGSDPEIDASSGNTVPVDGVALFPDSGDTPASASKFLAFDFVDPQDVLTINHNIRLPGGAGMLNGTRRVSSSEGNTLLPTDWGLFLRIVSGATLRVPSDVFDAAPIGAVFGIGWDSGTQNIGVNFPGGSIRLHSPGSAPESGEQFRLSTGGGTTAMCYKLTDVQLFAFATGPASIS